MESDLFSDLCESIKEAGAWLRGKSPVEDESEEREHAPIYTSEAGVHYKKPSEIIRSKAGQRRIRKMYEVFPPPGTKQEDDA